MRPFVYNSLPARVVFGSGTIGKVSEEIQALGCRRAVILSTPPQRGDAEALSERLGTLAAGVFSEGCHAYSR